MSLRALFEIACLAERPVLSPLVALVQLIDDILDARIDCSLGLANLTEPGSPLPVVQAQMLWKELRSHRDPKDGPLVGVGFLVYLVARLTGTLFHRDRQ